MKLSKSDSNKTHDIPKERHHHSKTWWWEHYAVGLFLADGYKKLVRVEGKVDGSKYM